jgi:hypothetical protein
MSTVIEMEVCPNSRSSKPPASEVIWPSSKSAMFFLENRLSKVEMIKADFVQRVSRLRSCLFSDYSMLADILSFDKNYS